MQAANPSPPAVLLPTTRRLQRLAPDAVSPTSNSESAPRAKLERRVGGNR